MKETEKVDYSFVLKEENFVAGDIVLWDGKKKVVADPNGFSLPASGYTPVGVVVVPASHMYDGQARMMSLRYMSCDDPENGNVVPERMIWGIATDLSGLTNFEQVPVIARYDDEDQGGVTALTDPQVIYTTNDYAFLPSDFPTYTGPTNNEDEGTRWYQAGTYWRENGTVSDLNFYAPSPYTSDGAPNPLYRATEYSGGSINNALSYFDGRHQTDVILEARGEKDYSSWKPTSGTIADYPPASCCDMYRTVGTSQGDWYLPSQAELGYIIARLNKINMAMAKVNGLQKLPHAQIWSSTEFSLTYARKINIGFGSVHRWDEKWGRNHVVAFATV